eukprot:8433871-Heterocapsa_arctica.AAC.1
MHGAVRNSGSFAEIVRVTNPAQTPKRVGSVLGRCAVLRSPGCASDASSAYSWGFPKAGSSP